MKMKSVKKMKSIRRSILVLLSMTLLLSLLGGCGTESSSSDGKATTAQSTDTKGQSGEKEVLSFSATMPDYGTVPTGKPIQEAWIKKMEELMDRKLDIKFNWVPWTDYSSKIKVLVGSGSVSDIIFTGTALEPSEVLEYGKKGVFEELTQYSDKLTNYLPKIKDYENGSWLTKDGLLYSFYGYHDTPDGNRRINLPTFIRKDILDANNLSLPGTLDELFDVAMKLKEAYPDVYPIGTQRNMLDTFLRINRVGGDVYLGDDMSEFFYGPITEAYKDTLQYMNKLYKNELIAPDYLAWTDDQKMAGVVNSQTFIYTTCWEYMFSNNNYNLDDAQKWVALVDLKNPKYGDPILWMSGKEKESPYTMQNAYHAEISATSKVDKSLLVKFMDLQYDEKVMELIVWGIEGVSFNYNDEGGRVWTEELMGENRETKALELGLYVFSDCRPGMSPNPGSVSASYLSFPEDTIYYKGKVIQQNLYLFARDNWTASGNYAANNLNKNIAMTEKEGETYSNIMTAIQTYVNENAVKFINGSRSFDQWDAYVADIYKLGDLKAALDIYNSYLK